MDNNKFYDSLITRARTRQRPNCYTERHHVIPRSIGGTDDETNIVQLTLKEHRLAHLLLERIHRKDHPNLVFAIYAFYNDANPQRMLFRTERKMPRWVRRRASVQASAVIRKQGYERALLHNMKRGINKHEG